MSLSFEGRGDYKPPNRLKEDLETQKVGNNNRGSHEESSYKMYTEIDGKKDQAEQKNKIGRKTTWMTSDSYSSDSNSYQTNQQEQQGINFDGIKYGLMGALNLFMKDNFTSYIVRGIQARNPNVGVVQILANPTVQKCKSILNRLRFECYIFTVLGLLFVLSEIIISIHLFTNESASIIVLLVVHFLLSVGMVWTLYAASRYFLPDKAKISMALCVVIFLLMIGLIITRSGTTNTLPNSISVLFLIQFLTSGLLFHIYRQINTIYKIFV